MTEKQEQRDRAAFPLGRAFAGGPRPSLQALLASESLRWARWGWGLTSVVARRLPCDGLAGPRRVLSLWVRQLQVAGGHRTLCPERHHEG